MDAILIVDLQHAFRAPTEFVDRIRGRAAGFPRRVFTRFINRPDSLMRRKLDRRSCAPGSPESELVLKPAPGDLVLIKEGYGFTADDIARLRDAGIGHVLLCGLDTDACVLGVAFTLFDAGIDVTVEPDLCWSSAGLHEPALAILHQNFGTPEISGQHAEKRMTATAAS